MERKAWKDLRAEYVETGAITPITEEAASHVSRAFLVTKPTEDGVRKFRLVIDLRKVNRHLRKMGLRYERLRDFGHLLRRDDWLVGFDIKNAYHHLRVRDAQQNFLQFRLEGELFQCVALPFGLSLSPYYFTHLMMAVVRFLRAPLRSCKTIPHFHFGCFAGDTSLADYYWRYAAGTPADILAYLDDFLAAMRDRADLREWVSLTRRVFHILGFEFKERKCEWEPTQLKRHLGVLIDTRRCLFLIPSEKEQKITEMAVSLLKSPRVAARTLARFCGLAISLHLAFPPARFFLQSLYDVLRTKRNWRDQLRLSPQARLDLQAWQHLGRWTGRAFAPESLPQIGTLATDASPTGWGATFLPSPDRRLLLARGFFNRASQHINVRELEAVRRAILAFFPTSGRRPPSLCQTSWARVRLKVDNQVVMYCLRSLCSPSLALMKEIRTLFYLLESRRIILEPEYIRSEDNVIPDRLSREANNDDYKLHPRLYRRLQRHFGPRTVDRFASYRNRQCERYNSLTWDVGTEAVDAFSQRWEDDHNWCNPPWSLLPRLVNFLTHRPRVEAVVIAPEWPQAMWFRPLQDLSSTSVLLPRQHEMFVPGHPGLPRVLQPPRWDLRAFHVTPR